MSWTVCVPRLFVFIALLITFTISGAAAHADNTGKNSLMFLVAKPEMSDPIFQHSVVLMFPPSATFPLVVGVIINKPTRLTLQSLLPNNPGLKNPSELAYFGGPVDVESPALVFQTPKALGRSLWLGDDTYVTLDQQTASGLLKTASGNQRLYLGRAQWSSDQLRQEMMEGAWYLVPAESSVLFGSDPKSIWGTLVARARQIPAMQLNGMVGGFTNAIPPGGPSPGAGPVAASF
jgi:putative transcriptional regulator